jgi:hypothetical protein
VSLDSLYASCHAYILFSLVEVFSNLSEDMFMFKKKWKRVITLNTEIEPKNRNVVTKSSYIYNMILNKGRTVM